MKAQKFTLLIVDDDKNARFLAQHTFESLATRYTVQLAASGDEAIAYLKGEGKFADREEFEFPAYIITDLKMHPGDGFHVLEFLKKHPALSLIPVVMLSSSDDADDIRQAYLLGASSFLVKPSTLEGLRVLLRKIHEYWAECEVPEVDIDGYAVPTNDLGRLGARYKKPSRLEVKK
jgi:CheY-like chemotaxis protein